MTALQPSACQQKGPMPWKGVLRKTKRADAATGRPRSLVGGSAVPRTYCRLGHSRTTCFNRRAEGIGCRPRGTTARQARAEECLALE